MGEYRFDMTSKMQIDENPKKILGFNPDKCNKLLEDLIDVFKTHKPTVGEILVTYGNLGYNLGAHIEGYEGKGPDIETLEKQYYTNPKPKVGIALMLQGVQITGWFQDHQEQETKEKDK